MLKIYYYYFFLILLPVYSRPFCSRREQLAKIQLRRHLPDAARHCKAPPGKETSCCRWRPSFCPGKTLAPSIYSPSSMNVSGALHFHSILRPQGGHQQSSWAALMGRICSTPALGPQCRQLPKLRRDAPSSDPHQSSGLGGGTGSLMSQPNPCQATITRFWFQPFLARRHVSLHFPPCSHRLRGYWANSKTRCLGLCWGLKGRPSSVLCIALLLPRFSLQGVLISNVYCWKGERFVTLT